MCGSGPESEAQTPSDVAAPLLQDFLQLRASLRAKPIGGGGDDVCRALTSSLDRAVERLCAEFEAGSNLAVVAVGGYGRSELSLFSDVDLMLLHDVSDPSEAAAVVFRPLWDAGLRLGHSVRNVKEAARAARERFDTFTTLLTSRLVAGDEELFGRLTVEMAAVTRARPLRGYLVAEERRRRQDSPYLRMAADVKTGRGGLRTLQGFEWERRREDQIGRFSPQAGPEEAVAREALLAIRNALHATAGRPYDIYSFDLREPVARWLGSDGYEAAERLVRAMQTIDHLATRRWPELADGPSRSRKVWARRRGDVAAVTPPNGEFTAILRSGERGRITIERLRESGRLSEVLPEWESVRTVPQLAPFHEHPLEAHLWRTVDAMRALLEGNDGHYSAIGAEVDSPDTLFLAAFLHDIGKGRTGDHSTIGAGIARAVCERLTSPPHVATLVEGAVRHHLLLSETATRRDLDDPAVIAEVAGTIGELRLLQVLYLLTVADSIATGATMWNTWKATLVRTLFVRCAALFGAEHPESPGTTREEVLARAGAARRSRVETHVAGMPDEYLRSTPADEVLWHFTLIEELKDELNLGFRGGDAAETIVLAGRGRRHLRRLAAAALAANGVDVLEARMATRTDGIIVDSYQVTDDRTGRPVPTDRWGRIRADLEKAAANELESKVAARADAYSPVAPNGIQPNVTVSMDDASGEGMIAIRCSDRIGRLAELLSILHECDLDIRLAKLDSRGGEVVDTFHVRGAGMPTDPAGFDRLAERIRTSIRG